MFVMTTTRNRGRSGLSKVPAICAAAIVVSVTVASASAQNFGLNFRLGSNPSIGVTAGASRGYSAQVPNDFPSTRPFYNGGYGQGVNLSSVRDIAFLMETLRNVSRTGFANAGGAQFNGMVEPAPVFEADPYSVPTGYDSDSETSYDYDDSMDGPTDGMSTDPAEMYDTTERSFTASDWKGRTTGYEPPTYRPRSGSFGSDGSSKFRVHGHELTPTLHKHVRNTSPRKTKVPVDKEFLNSKLRESLHLRESKLRQMPKIDSLHLPKSNSLHLPKIDSLQFPKSQSLHRPRVQTRTKVNSGATGAK